MLAFGLSLVAARLSHAQLAKSSWPSFRHDAALSGRTTTIKGPTDPVIYWTKQIGVGNNLSPVVAQNGAIIFTSANHGVIYALNPDSTRKWTFEGSETGDTAFNVPAVIDVNDSIYIGSRSGGFLSIRPDSILNWREPVGGDVSNAANIDRFGNIYFVASDNQLYSYRADRRKNWNRYLGNVAPSGTPAIGANDKIFVPAGGHLYVYDTSGVHQGTWAHPNVVEIAWVIANNDRVYIGSANTPVVAAFNLFTGTPRESFSYANEVPPDSHPCVAAAGKDNVIFFTDSNENVMFALTLNLNIRPNWPKRFGDKSFQTMPVVDAAGRVYIVSNDSRYGLMAISPESGDTLWAMPQVRCKQQDCDTHCRRSLAFGADGTIYVPTSDTLYAVRQKPHPDSLEFVSPKDLFFCYDSTLQAELKVLVKDQYDKPFPNHHVTFTVETNGSVFDTTTGANGIAQFRWHLEKSVGTQRVRVTSAGISSELVFAAHIAAPIIRGDTSIAFGTMRVGDAAITKRDSVTSRSRCPLLVYKPEFTSNPDNAFSLVGTYPNSTVLDSSKSLRYEVKFAPKERREYIGKLRFRNSDSTKPNFEVTLRGIARAPEIEVAPVALPFGAVCVGDSRVDTLEVSNKGDTTLHVIKLDFSNPVFTSTDTVFLLEPDSSRKVSVTFKPVEKKNYAGARLTLTHDDRSKPAVVVPLSGVGVADSIAGDSTVVFGATALHAPKDSSYHIRALGFCALRIDTIKIVGKNASDFSWSTSKTLNFPFEIPAGRDTTIWIRFKPDTHGERQATMQIENSDMPHNPFAVQLYGFGVGKPQMTVPQKSLTFPKTCVGLTLVDSVLIRSIGSAPLRVTGFSRPTDLAFTIKDSSFTIEPRDSAFVRVCFAPYRKLSYDASFQIFSNDDTVAISLRGSADWPTISNAPPLTFDSTWVCQSSIKGYGVRSSGLCELLIQNVPTISGANPNDFEIVPESLCSDYPPQSTRRFCLRFRPQDSGWRTAELKFESNAGAFTVTLRGYGKLDTFAPEAPRNLAVDKTEWSRINSFKLTWTNPPDTCDIAAAHYQIGDSLKKKDGANISSLEVKAPDVGSYKVYVWLEDGKGNMNPQKRDSVTIKFDNVPPRIAHDAIDSWPVETAIVVPATATEPANESGVDPTKFRLLYSLGGKGLNPAENTTFAEGEAVIPAKSVTARGVEYDIEVVDWAGNSAKWSRRRVGFQAIKILLKPGSIQQHHVGGKWPEDYRLFSLPLAQQETNIDKIFPPNFFHEVTARLWDIHPNSDSAQSTFPFREYNPWHKFTPLKEGRALLLITAHDIWFNSSFGSTVATDTTFEIHLKPGWNLIASPFNFDIPLENLKMKRPTSLFFFDGDWRVAAPNSGFKLRPWEGYALKLSPGARDTTLLLHPSEHPVTQSLTSLVNPNWLITIDAVCAQSRDRNNFVGVAEAAMSEWDEYEQVEPPRAVDYIMVYFPQALWKKHADWYTTDVRPLETSGSYIWNFTVRTTYKGEQVRLHFDNLASVPESFQIYLHDLQSSRVISLRNESEYDFRSSSMGAAHDFRLLVGDTVFARRELPQAAFAPTAFELLPNYPNPFNPATTIAFSLSQTSEVSLTLYNLKGERVRALLVDAFKNAGYHSVVWNGKNEEGQEAASGLYLCRLQAGKLNAIRKIAFIK